MDFPPAAIPHRVVLLIDLNPFFSSAQIPSPNTRHLRTSILLSAKALLSHPPLSSSLFAVRPFFSSLSPILSTSRAQRLLGKFAAFLSFDLPGPTLASLSRTLASLSSSAGADSDLGSPKADFTAKSLFQLGCECSWESSSRTGGIIPGKENLVLLFSCFPRSVQCLGNFLVEEASVDEDSVSKRFGQVFGPANGLFAKNDVHLCWVDVGVGEGQELGEEKYGLDLLKRGIESMGWGFCSTDAIVLGSSVLPFGLIYPTIGFKLVSELGQCVGKSQCIDLSLEILDVSGKPLECKCCDLEACNLGIGEQNLEFWSVLHGSHQTGGIGKICMKGVFSVDQGVKRNDKISGLFFLRGLSDKCKKEKKGEASANEFFADRLLDLLCSVTPDFAVRKPIWQLVLSFLFRRKLWGFVSISGCESTHFGIMKPLTINTAILGIVDNQNDALSPEITCNLHLPNTEHLSECNGSNMSDLKERRNKKQLSMISNLSWSSFFKLVFSQPNDIGLGVSLEDVYMTKERKSSKKLRFLQCWMKQVIRSGTFSEFISSKQTDQPNVQENTDMTPMGSQEVTGPFACTFPVSETSASQSECEPLFPCSIEDLESFVGSLPEKIEQVLCSEEVDLGDRAERLVSLTVNASYAKFQKDSQKEVGMEAVVNNCDSDIAAEVSKLLLMKPKDLAAKHKSSNPSSLACKNMADIHLKKNKVREHELQILFRMEILRSSVVRSVDENVKLKILKEICSLLENIEFSLQGDMFSGESLVDFADRIIKGRYSRYLGDVIHKIYAQMEFFSFDGGDEELSQSQHNSSNHNDGTSQDKVDDFGDATMGVRDKVAAIQGSTKGCPSQLPADDGIQKPTENATERQLRKAKERRERARRFSHFTGRMQNMQRVWAPKQLKTEKSMFESASTSQLQRRRRRTYHNDAVMETPMTLKKPSRSHESDCSAESQPAEQRSESFRSISKALFSDEVDSETA